MKTYKAEVNVVIPVYNEGDLIIDTLINIQESLVSDYLIQICYDFDGDNTLTAIRNSSLINKNYIIYTKNNKRGPHSAIMQGLKRLSCDYSIVIPADDNVNSKNLHKLVSLARTGVDIVCPSRFMEGGRMTGAPIIKYCLNRFVNLTLFHFARLPTADATNGFRLFSKKVIDNIEIKSKDGFTYSIEYLIKAYKKNMAIKEFPSIWIERNAGKSKFKLSIWWFSYFYLFLYGIIIGISVGVFGHEKK